MIKIKGASGYLIIIFLLIFFNLYLSAKITYYKRNTEELLGVLTVELGDLSEIVRRMRRER